MLKRNCSFLTHSPSLRKPNAAFWTDSLNQVFYIKFHNAPFLSSMWSILLSWPCLVLNLDVMMYPADSQTTLGTVCQPPAVFWQQAVLVLLKISVWGDVMWKVLRCFWNNVCCLIQWRLLKLHFKKSLKFCIFCDTYLTYFHSVWWLLDPTSAALVVWTVQCLVLKSGF